MSHTSHRFTVRPGAKLLGALLTAVCLGAVLSACGPAPSDATAGSPARASAPASAPVLPSMPGARPAEALPTIDAKQLEKAVATEAQKQASEIRAGTRDAEQSHPVLPPVEPATASPAAGASSAAEVRKAAAAPKR